MQAYLDAGLAKIMMHVHVTVCVDCDERLARAGLAQAERREGQRQAARPARLTAAPHAARGLAARAVGRVARRSAVVAVSGRSAVVAVSGRSAVVGAVGQAAVLLGAGGVAGRGARDHQGLGALAHPQDRGDERVRLIVKESCVI